MAACGVETYVTRAILLGALLVAGPARADERTAADVAGAPLPGEESGRTDPPQGDSTLRDVGQAVLWPPRMVFALVMLPVRSLIWVNERYALGARATQLLFNDDLTFGIYPILLLQSDYGVTVGARFLHRDLFGDNEHLSVRATYGGTYYELVQASLNSGTRFGDRVVAEIGGIFERLPRERFYGIGNLGDDEAIKSFYRQQLWRALGVVSVRAVDSLNVLVSGAIGDLHFSPSRSEPSIQDVFDVIQLTGWPDYTDVYGELAVQWDSRRYPRKLDGQHATYNAGWLVHGYAGLVHPFGVGDDYVRYGGEIQHHLGIAIGPRVLSTRLHVDAVTGGYDDVAFSELPQLGGMPYLRGYPIDRFRDRVAIVGSAEYTWDVGRKLMASLFSDAGRVYSSFEDITLDDLRVSFGASLQLHVDRQFIGNVTIATSIDGGVFLYLVLSPVFNLVPRVEQR